MKPVNYYTFSLKLTRAIGRIQKIEKEILLKQQDSVKKVPVEEIYYVEIQNRMLYYHTSEGEYVVRGTIKNALDMLSPYHFVKCNHWYIVNLKYVTEVRDSTVIVAGKELEISQRKKNTFLNDTDGLRRRRKLTMSWIVNILATLIYLGFGIIYAVGFSKRKHFRYSIVVTAAAIFSGTGRDVLCFRWKTGLER